MPKELPGREEVVQAIQRVAAARARPPSRAEFMAETGIREYHILKHFSGWNEAVKAAGLQPNTRYQGIGDYELWQDWAAIVRQHRHIPTRDQYRREGKYSPDVFESHFGPWSRLPEKFRKFASDKIEWSDVLALLPVPTSKPTGTYTAQTLELADSSVALVPAHSRLNDRPTYGNPIDFRGLRHEPVNEQGVVFLFGMVAKELGYLVEAVQSGFPDCEAKRQVEAGKWQRVRIEFEFESKNFRDHGHAVDGCDVIVCWRHNWTDSPPTIEVIELSSVLKTLASSDD